MRKCRVQWKVTAAGVLVFGLLLSGLASGADESPWMLPLETDWRLQSSAEVHADGAQLSTPGFDASTWYPVTVPKTVLAALVDNGVYPDPYYGLNLKRIPGYQDGLWLEMPQDSPFRASWWWRTERVVPASWRGRHVFLQLDGLNYRANVWVNGQHVAGPDTLSGMFQRFELPVTAYLHFGGPNVLAIETTPPGLLDASGARTKQLEATTGWDDHNPQPPDMNTGLWQPVRLRADGPVSLRHAYVETRLETPTLERATLIPSVFARNNTDQSLEAVITARIDGVGEFRQVVSLSAGETREIFFRPEAFPELNVQQPRVWWPAPLGPQELYTLAMTVETGGAVSDTCSTRFGIREITTALNEDHWRYYVVNGRKILIRGGAWMTSDMLLNLSRARYEALVRYAREAGLNMLRSEGFSIRETDTFYDLCDELGVMVTQQLFGRSIPDESLAIACVEDTMLRIRNHPSLAHFLGHDETFPTETLDQAYRDLIARHRLNRTYQPHSGTFTITTRKKTGGTRTGTRELWTYASPAHYYWVERKADVAWGFAQSGGIGGILAPRDSLRQMLPAEDLDRPMATEAWSFHTVTQGAEYFDAVLRAMERSYGPASGFDDFCRKIHAMNYASARGMFEAYGWNKYDATGITTWKYDAAWPAAMTWQYVDWYLRATAAYYGAKKACEPLHVQYVYRDGTVWVINSLRQRFDGLRVRAWCAGLDGAPAGDAVEAIVSVDEDGKTLAFAAPTPPEPRPATWLLCLALRDGDRVVSENRYWLSSTPDIPGRDRERDGIFETLPKSVADYRALESLPTVPVRVTWERTREQDGTIRLSARARNEGNYPAFQVWFKARAGTQGMEIGPAYWDDNCLILLPGEEKALSCVVPAWANGADQAVVGLEGWNVTPVP